MITARLERSPPLEVIANSQIASRLNKIAREARTAAIAKMRETYNLSRNEVGRHIGLVRASPSMPRSGIAFRAKAIPLEAFKPRVEMRPVQIKTRRGVRTQRLPHILLNRYVGRAAKLIPSAFPLRQRNTGRLRSGEKVRKRTSAARGYLTYLRYYLFPKRYLFGELLPYLQTLSGASLRLAFRFVVRSRRYGRRDVVRGVQPQE